MAETNTLKQSYAFGESAGGKSNWEKPLKIYLFGYPIAHSLAPLLHSTLLETMNVPWTYTLIESLSPTDFVPKLKSDDCIGSAVTMPHKVTFMNSCDELTEEARVIGAINTIFIRKEPLTGRRLYVGTNTDCIGIREAFLQNYPDILPRCRENPTMVIGGGGACRSAIYTLWKWMGASEIYLVNRLDSEVEDIIAGFANTSLSPKLTHIKTVKQAAGLPAPVVIVDTVPDCRPEKPGEIRARDITVQFLQVQPRGYALEMCYHPRPETAFYNLATQYGWQVLTGAESMIHQGIAQEVLWMERPLEEISDQKAKKAVQAELVK